MPTALTTDTLAAEHLTAPALDAVPSIRHGFFTRRGGVSTGLFASLNCGVHSGDDLRLVLNNRARVATTLRVSRSRLVSPTQIHGAGVVVVKEGWEPGHGPEADGMVTRERGLAIGVGTADCAPILFADPEARVVGAAHAGWGGAIKGVIEATVNAMIRLGAHNGDIVAAVGPTIAQASYEVGPEFRDRFLAEDPNNALFFRAAPRQGHSLFDLHAYVLARLARLGLRAVNGMPDFDTYADDDRFFSFRRATHRGEKEYGRMISAIALA
jgi:YfiH family protein